MLDNKKATLPRHGPPPNPEPFRFPVSRLAPSLSFRHPPAPVAASRPSERAIKIQDVARRAIGVITLVISQVLASSHHRPLAFLPAHPPRLPGLVRHLDHLCFGTISVSIGRDVPNVVRQRFRYYPRQLTNTRWSTC